MILLGSELSNRGDVKPLIVTRIAKHGLEQLDVTRRIDNLGLVGELPQLVDVILRPRRVDHDAIGASTRPAVETREQVVVGELDTGERGRAADRRSVVEVLATVGDQLQHVGALKYKNHAHKSGELIKGNS